jgi:Pentapeptide repeats (8 copies)
VWANAWHWYHLNRDDITPLGTFAGAAVVAWAALRQAKTARLRHEKQTEADRQRRITESFSKAAEQLGNDKLEVRLGGIYTMERISRESPEDYWPVMETLTAFVRERARWKEPDEGAFETLLGSDEAPGRQPGYRGIPTDIEAVLSVIRRREKANYERERQMEWSFDLRGTDLRRADLIHAHLGGAILYRTHLEGALLRHANLERASLHGANLKGADLDRAHLEGAWLIDAHLENAALIGAYLENAKLLSAYLEGANLFEAHLEGADLGGATGLDEAHLPGSYGDASTKLPKGVARPANWPSVRR